MSHLFLIPFGVGIPLTMRKTTFSTLLGSILMLFHAAYALPGAQSPISNADITADVTESDQGMNLVLRRDSTLVVKLLSYRSTGFTWSARQSDPVILMQHGAPVYCLPSPVNRAVGGGGYELWTFRAAKSGSTTLTLSCGRSSVGQWRPVKVLVWPVSVVE